MNDTTRVIDSETTGNPETFKPLAELESALNSLPAAPLNRGRVSLLVRRIERGCRETLDKVRLEPETGMPGDAWGRRPPLKPEMQLAVMQRDVAELIANGQPLTLFGDNLFIELDLSKENLPTGSRVRAGGAVFEVTPMPHNGCKKFRARFGDDALRLVSNPEIRHRNLRGIYFRVVEPGEVAVGDPVEVLARGPAPAAASV